MRILVSISLLFFTLLGFSQNPGGVPITVWYKASVGVDNATNNTRTYNWANQTSSSYNAFSVGSNGVFYQNNATENINFNPTLSSDGTSYFGVNRLPITGTNFTIIGVGLRQDNGDHTFIGDGSYPNGERLTFGHVNNRRARLARGGGGENLQIENLNRYNEPAESPYLLAGLLSTTNGKTLKYFRDGFYEVATDNETGTLGGFSNMRIGSSDQNDPNNGTLAEILVFSSALSELDQLRVYSYLSIKYAIPLSADNDGDATLNETISGLIKEGDYIASDGSSIIWNYNLQGVGFSTDVVGIGRDDNSGLNQKQTKLAADEGLITIGLGSVDSVNNANFNTFSTDKSFLLWGNNDGANTFSTTGAPAGRQILGKKWRVQESGSVGTVKLRIPANSSTLNSKLPLVGSLDLLVDLNDDFSTGATIYKMTLNGTHWEVDVDFNTAEYFAFSPGGASLSVTQSGNEAGPINIVFTVTLPDVNNTGSAITFDIEDVGTGTATVGSDYTAIPAASQISVANNSLTGTFTVTVLNDAVAEGIETIIAEISNPSDPSIFITEEIAEAQIFDDDGGPGGVRNNLNVWLKSDAGAGSTNNDNVSSWTDFSFNGNNGSADGNPPKYRNNVTDNINFNPVVLFDGVNDRLVLDLSGVKSANTSGGRFTIFSVGKRTDGNENNFIGSDNYTFNQKFHFGYTNNASLNFNGANDQNITVNNFNNPAITPFGVFGTQTSTGKILEELRNGLFRRGTNTFTGNIQGNLTNYLGGTVANGAYFQGPITEIIVFEEAINNLQKQQVNSYLALKYGLQLTNNNNNNGTLNEILSGTIREGDYVASDGATVVWNYSTQGIAYFNDVAGIARDDAGAFTQKQSKSTNSDALVTMGLGSIALTNAANANAFSINNSFLLWGNNNDAITFTTTGAPANKEILSRKWRVQETGTVGSVLIRVPDNSSTLSTKLPAATRAIQLLQDADGNFAAGSTSVQMTLNGTNWEATVDFTNGQYFTFAQAPTPVVLSVTQEGSETGPISAVFTVILSKANNTGSAITFDFDDLGTGSATSASDYTAIAGSAQISIANNALSGSISIPIIDDGASEPIETIIAQISNPSSATVEITKSIDTASIADNDIGPGGVSNDLQVWLRADKSTSTTVNNSSLATWVDFSGSGNDAIQDGNPPAFLDNALNNVNFNPTVDFDGIDDRLQIDLSSIKNSTFTLFVVGERDDATSNYAIGSEGGTANQDLHFGYRDGDDATLAYWGNDENLGVANFNIPAITPYILMGRQSNSDRLLQELRDGLFTTTEDNNTTQISGLKTNYIGDLESVENYNGRINEVIAYNGSLGVLDRQRVYTYLGLKYGILLPADNNANATSNELLNGINIREGDYVASNDAIIWDYAARGSTYFNNIAGIGRDDEAGLYQKQSKSIHTNALLTIGLGSIATTNKINSNTFPSDLSYMLWGHNSGALTLSTTGAPSNSQIIARKWQIEETGTVGLVKIKVPASTSPTSTKLPVSDAMKIFVDADGDFTSGAVGTFMTLVGTNWEVSINLLDGDYISFGTQVETANLNVTVNGNEVGPVAIELTVTLSAINNTGLPIIFDIDDLGTGSATSGSDYTAVAGNATINVANGDSTGTFIIAVLNDALAEGPETIELYLSNPSIPNVSIGQDTVVASIGDDDASPSPGGVFDNLIFWYKGDAGVSPGTNGIAVTQWDDQSPGGQNATDIATGPTFNSVFNNYNPALNFSTTTGGLGIADDNEINTSSSSEKAFSIVFTTGADITTRQLIYEEGGGTHGLNLYILNSQLFSNIWMSQADNAAGTSINENTTYIYTFVYNGNATPNGRWDGYLEGVSVSVDANVPNQLPAHIDDTGLGVINGGTQYDGNIDQSGGDGFFGKILEIAYYNNNVLSTAARGKIHSYFATKYGITLTTDFVASNGFTVWSQASNAGYTSVIAGIGRDDFSTLNQKQSKSNNKKALIAIGLGSVQSSNALNPNSFTTDYSAMYWGHNGGANAFSPTNSPTNTQTLARVWKVQESGTVGAVFMQIPSIGSSSTEKLPAISTLNLLVDGDGDFTAGATVIPMTLNGNNWEVSVDFTTGQYFTLSSPGVILSVTTNGDEAGPIDAVFTVTLPGNNSNPNPITFDLTDSFSGTATSGSDYTAIPPGTKISIASGASSGSYPVVIVDDIFIEGTETFTLSISNPSDPGVSIGGASATATIVDNEVLETVGPGGVNDSLVFWLKADEGTNTLIDGGSVTIWNDQTDNTNNATSNGTAPLYKLIHKNYNPAIDVSNNISGGFTIQNNASINFNGSDYGAKSYTITFTTGNDVVTRQLIYEQGGQTNGLNLYISNDSLVANIWNNSADNAIYTKIEDSTTYVVTFVFDGSVQSTFLYVNGELAGNDNNVFTALLDHSGAIGLGKIVNSTQYNPTTDVSSNEGFLGYIMEMAYYNEKVLSTVERKRVESYFAIKYGVSLASDYVNSEGTVVWDSTTNYAFNADITAIGVDATSQLFQKQSTSSSSQYKFLSIGLGALEVSNKSNLNNTGTGLDFLIWGNNNASKTGVPSNALLTAQTGEVDRILRKWKIIETNDVPTVQLVFNRDSVKANMTFSQFGNYYLKIADDSSLTTNVTYLVLDSTQSVNGSPSFTASFDFSGTKYFTVVQKDFILWSGQGWRGGESSTNPHHPSVLAADAAKSMYIFKGDSALAIEPIEINNIVIKDSADLVITPTNCLKVSGTFTNNGGLVFSADSNGYAQYIGPPVKATFQQYVDDAGWHLIGSPFSDVTFSDFNFYDTLGADSNGFINYPLSGISQDSCIQCNLWYYDVSTDNGTDIGFGSSDAFGTWRSATNASQNFRPDRGWNIYLDEGFGFSSSPFILQITGTFNNGTFLDTVNENNAGWNLMANPYPSVIDWNAVDDDLAAAGIANGYHIWNHENTNYAVYANGTGTLGTNRYIAPFQGFYVQTSSIQPQNGGDILHDFELTNGDRPSVCSGDSSDFFKVQQLNQVFKLRTRHNGSGKIDETAVLLSPSASRSFIPSEDIHKLFTRYTDAPSLYTRIEGNNQSITTLPLTGEKDSIRVGCRTKNGSSVTIELMEAPAGYTVYLEDIKTGIWNRIDTDPYTFTQDERYENRFWLHFAPFALQPSPWQQGKPFYTYIKDGSLVIKTQKNVIDARWYLSTASGQVIKTGRIVEDDVQEYSTNIDNLAPGAYFFVLITSENRYTDKLLKL